MNRPRPSGEPRTSVRRYRRSGPDPKVPARCYQKPPTRFALTREPTYPLHGVATMTIVPASSPTVRSGQARRVNSQVAVYDRNVPTGGTSTDVFPSSIW